MAIGIHTVRVVNSSHNRPGNVVEKSDVPNSSGSPDVTTYVALEAADDYITHVYQNMCISYSAADTNNAS